MIQNTVVFIVNGDGSFFKQPPNTKFTANSVNKNSIFVIAPFVNTASIIANFKVAHKSKQDSRVATLTDMQPREITNESYVFDWNVWEVKVPQPTLQFLANNRGSEILVSFTVGETQVARVIPKFDTILAEITDTDFILPSITVDGRYIVKVASYEYANGLYAFFNDTIIADNDNQRYIVYRAKYSGGTTPTVAFKVDPSIPMENFDEYEPTVVEQLIIQTNENSGDIVDLENEVVRLDNKIDDEANSLDQKVDAHIEDLDNPHSVTAEQVGTYDKATIDSKDANILQEVRDLDERVDTIIAGTVEGVSGAEIVDARQGEATLGANITKIKSELAETVKKGDIVVDIRDFGAIADFDYDTKIGTDNTQAFINAIDSIPLKGGTLLVPAGDYLITNGEIIIDKPITIIGEGAGTYDEGGSRIFTLSATANLFTLTKGGTVVTGIAFINASNTRPTAGSALLCTDFDWGRIERCLFRGFWNNVQVDSGYFYSIRDTAFLAPVNYGCYMRNTATGQHDHGDQVLEGCNFSKYGDVINGATAVRWESGGGLRIIGCKVNAGTQPGYPNTGFFENGFVTVMQPGGTSVHTITGCSIEGWLNHGISISGTAGAAFGKISITGNEFLGSGSGGACVHADGNNMIGLNNIVITGNVGYGPTGGVILYNLKKAVVTSNNWSDCTQAALTVANVTDLIQSNNLFKSTIFDGDASNYSNAKAGHNRGAWVWSYNVFGLITSFDAGKIKPGNYSEIILGVKVYGNVATVGGFIIEQKRAINRVLGNTSTSATIGTDIAVGAGATEISITFDHTTSPEYVIPKISTINGKSFTGAIEITVNGAISVIYYT